MVLYVGKKVEVRKKLVSGSYSANVILIEDSYGNEERIGVGKKKDKFSFKIDLPKNNVFESYYSGTGLAVAFTLKYYQDTWDAEFLVGDNQKVFVYVNGTLKTYTTDYTLSGSTLTFGSAPASGSDNIKVVFSVLESGDLVRTYKKRSSKSFTADDIIIEGTIDTPSSSITPSGNVLTINGVGIIENIFAALVFVRDVALTQPHLIIQSVINQINNYNPLRKIYGANPAEWAAIGNATARSDSSAFPTIQYSSSYKSALEVVEEISGDNYTKDGNYFFYMVYNGTDDRYEFHWKYKKPELSSSATIVWNSYIIVVFDVAIVDSNCLISKLSKSNSEVINAIIYNVGLDCNEVPWEFLNFANTSMVGHGTKWKYVIGTNNIFSDLINREFEADRTLWAVGADGNRTSNYPIDSSSWTFQFKTRNTDGSLTGTAATATSDTEFNDALKLEAEAVGKEATDRILLTYGAPRLKAEFEFPFLNSYTLGDLTAIVSTRFGIENYPLRLVEIKHDEWTTTLYYEEDEVTAINRIINA